MAEANRLQDVYMAEFRKGLTGDQLLGNMLTRARREGIPTPRVYSHSLGHLELRQAICEDYRKQLPDLFRKATP